MGFFQLQVHLKPLAGAAAEKDVLSASCRPGRPEDCVPWAGTGFGQRIGVLVGVFTLGFWVWIR